MHRVIKKAHIYAGLISFTAFIVYGIAGLRATFLAAPADRPAKAIATRYVEFDTPGGMTDKALADHVFATLDLPLTEPLRERDLRRDDEQHLRMDFYNPNGLQRVTVLEDEGRIRIDTQRTSTWEYLSGLHATIRNPGPLMLRVWNWYNELAMFSLLFMALSGVYLWLTSRPEHKLAQLSFATGSGMFLALLWWFL